MALVAQNGVSHIGGSAELTPRPVSRGVKLQLGYFGLDSLYLVLEYPRRDVFDFWAQIVGDMSDRRLYTGIPFEDYLVRRGGLGYKLSVWDGDARLFITDRVDDELSNSAQVGQGMGVMLQLGPKWLIQYGDVVNSERLRQHIYAQFVLFGIKNPETYPIRLNRLDIALDMIGLAVADFSLDQWRAGWVGYASQKTFHDSADTGKLEGLSIGSSEGAIRFKVYDKVAQSLKIGASQFWRSVWALAADEFPAVARFEWSIKPYGARFVKLRYLADFTFDGFMELINYASLRWGRLCIPSPDDSNQSRWELDPLWAELRRLIDEWRFNFEGCAKRDYHFKPDLNDAYLSTAAGWIGGLMARLGIDQGGERPASVVDALTRLESEGHFLTDKAYKKWAVITKLVGGGELE